MHSVLIFLSTCNLQVLLTDGLRMGLLYKCDILQSFDVCYFPPATSFNVLRNGGRAQSRFLLALGAALMN